jgi:hypothetical protein
MIGLRGFSLDGVLAAKDIFVVARGACWRVHAFSKFKRIEMLSTSKQIDLNYEMGETVTD